MTQAGHSFLASLGKTRLRPGGIRATNWLLSKATITKDTKILEVACNQCTNAIDLVKKTGCSITAVDLDKKVVDIAKHRVAAHGLTDHIKVEVANALSLPYPDQSFDLVINEAMLTMLGDKQKNKAVAEYRRVLKPGGVLITHDVLLMTDNQDQLVSGLQRVIHVPAKPYHQANWEKLFLDNGFDKLDCITGEMSLMNPIGMIRDEGIGTVIKIFKNAMKAKNRTYFKEMFTFFNQHKKDLGFIAIISYKE
ncbi:Methyltransferase domain-containing protein [Amphibacillus marinus]|uniref:Methyltransferase domain-containing protein n=1 Tax=Amphibacillus marinus TaxID=872970 RepID=A0A1H8LLK6_9BACI|nr:class I SAM-dependent methyltransferase [Amphibacillus marinus]SEO06040.1 Methyltransferase domain-containing protein [Amphibacillus marinus]